jgi:hypothetical protein
VTENPLFSTSSTYVAMWQKPISSSYFVLTFRGSSIHYFQFHSIKQSTSGFSEVRLRAVWQTPFLTLNFLLKSPYQNNSFFLKKKIILHQLLFITMKKKINYKTKLFYFFIQKIQNFFILISRQLLFIT